MKTGTAAGNGIDLRQANGITRLRGGVLATSGMSPARIAERPQRRASTVLQEPVRGNRSLLPCSDTAAPVGNSLDEVADDYNDEEGEDDLIDDPSVRRHPVTRLRQEPFGARAEQEQDRRRNAQQEQRQPDEW